MDGSWQPTAVVKGHSNGEGQGQDKKNRGQKMKMLRIRQVENLVACLGTFIRAWVFSFWPGHFLKGKCPGYVKTAQTMPNGLL